MKRKMTVVARATCNVVPGGILKANGSWTNNVAAGNEAQRRQRTQQDGGQEHAVCLDSQGM